MSLGMSRIGYIGFKGGELVRGHSEYLQGEMDKEIKRLIDEGEQLAERVIEERKDEIERLANMLIEKESLGLVEIVEILGEKPGGYPKRFIEFLETRKEVEKELEEEPK